MSHWETKQVVSAPGEMMGGAGESSLHAFGVHPGPEYLTAMNRALVAPRQKFLSGRWQQQRPLGKVWRRRRISHVTVGAARVQGYWPTRETTLTVNGAVLSPPPP